MKYARRQRISPRDIGIILNKVMEEMKADGTKEEEQEQDDAGKNQEQEQQLLYLLKPTSSFPKVGFQWK
ncbi:MAG TPA: hypothetical protein VE818_07415 [Nitrososphaeraceae archaeon]|nr:hypothetical protein [Nitrososphaeraceae archaeon]